ncbi:MAG: hypothetical protein CMF60_08710 [Magnetococcales bacterium]|nr:hypothetical protein [Magnetococcales bacterium]|tara:strand:- start:24369 stop:24995 length:627 start_codon:yes stop_codon:yes gene_type:complete
MTKTLKLMVIPAILMAHTPDAMAWEPDVNKLINSSFHSKIKNFLQNDIVTASVENQNAEHANLDNEDILALDKDWRAETKATNQPFVSSLLNRPLSAYLTRIQAHENGLFSEIFIMDNKGLNVGQSAMSSDYWQGDEAKWQKTYSKEAGAIFVDEPEFNSGKKVWLAQYNVAVTNGKGQNIGAATFEVNLNELARQQGILKYEEVINE